MNNNQDQSNFQSLLNKVHLGSSPEFLQNIPDDTVALTFTSPPYYDSDLYILDGGKLEFGWKSYSDYLDHLSHVIAELYRITIPGGRLTLVLSNSPETNEDEEVQFYWPIIHDVVHDAIQTGWQMIDEVIWAKKKDIYPYLEQQGVPETSSKVKHDVITVFRKPGPRRSSKKKYPISSIWYLKDKGPVSKYNKAYPSFPNELVMRVLRSWSLPGDIVLDPYAGSGQVCRIAIELERFTIGIEMDEKWAELWEDINL